MDCHHHQYSKKMKIILGLLFLLHVHPLQATILACADRIEKVKKVKEKEGLGELGKAVCKNAKKKKLNT